jgi:AraC-like DNA-binding protein
MNTQEATIESLQNRIKYLEAHLHLALQVLNEIENDSQEVAKSLEYQHQSQTIDIIPNSKIQLPTFLHARTWKHDYPDAGNYENSRDHLVARAS